MPDLIEKVARDRNECRPKVGFLTAVSATCIVVISVVLFGCGGQPVAPTPAPSQPTASRSFNIGSHGGRLLSADGVLLADVPSNSGAPSSLTVTPVDLSTLAGQFDNGDLVAAYELGPDGTRFSRPVTIEIDLTKVAEVDRDVGWPLLWVSEGSEFELADNQVVIDEGPGGAFVLRGETTHFSKWALHVLPNLDLEFTSDDFKDVGQNVSSSATLVATAKSRTKAFDVVGHVTSFRALSSKRQGRNFRSLDGGEKKVPWKLDDVTCKEASYGIFKIVVQVNGISVWRNGKRAKPETVRREFYKYVFCHEPSGSVSVKPSGTGTGGAISRITVSPPSVIKKVGETFEFDVKFTGRTGHQTIQMLTYFPKKIISPAAPGVPPQTGAATNVKIHPKSASFTLNGDGGIKIKYKCIDEGSTGIEFFTNRPPFMSGTAKVTCNKKPPEGD